MQNPKYESLRTHALSLPKAEEIIAWDHPTWRIYNKMFAIADQENLTVSLKTTPDRKPILEQDPAIEPAPYLHNKGWVQITISDESSLEMAKSLLTDSYQLIIQKLTKKQQAELNSK